MKTEVEGLQSSFLIKGLCFGGQYGVQADSKAWSSHLRVMWLQRGQLMHLLVV